ncbi:MAG: hypothetical protein AB1547_04210 [Thermodesulfobacteriota bacterium]
MIMKIKMREAVLAKCDLPRTVIYPKTEIQQMFLPRCPLSRG